MDRYVVIGNPISHSLSPAIHARFAAAEGERIEYGTLEVPEGRFTIFAQRFFDEGGRGANVTLPFKVNACHWAGARSDRAELAGAANFLAKSDGRIEADNTDGAGLVADLTRNLDVQLDTKRVLLVGAGGAARGVVGPLLASRCAALVIANRTLDRARALAARFASLGRVEAVALDAIGCDPFDLVINATSSSTRGERLALADYVLGPCTLAYDMAYGDAARAFLDRARARGAQASDGLGMLVEQAAESYFLWRGRRPATAAVLRELRKRIS